MTEPASLLDLFLAVETEAAVFYEALARRFADRPELRTLWASLAEDEREHANWIREIRESTRGDAILTGLPKLRADPLEAALHEIKRQRERIEREVYSVVEALAATIALETSEVNDTLADLVATVRRRAPSDPFVRETATHFRRLTDVLDRLSHPELSALLKRVAQEPEQRLLRRRMILVVDDEADMVENCARILQRSGHTCLTATNGHDALALLRRERADLIITDLRMPGMDGLALLRQAREVAPEIPVVIYTAYVSADSAREALEAGASAYLHKPFTATQLRLTVEEILGGQR